MFYVYHGRVYIKNGEKLVDAGVDFAMFGAQKLDETYVEGMVLRALNDANVRILAGSLSVAPSKAGVGLTVGFLQNEDVVTVSVGNNVAITVTVGDYYQQARQNADVMVVTVAASIGTGTSSNDFGRRSELRGSEQSCQQYHRQ